MTIYQENRYLAKTNIIGTAPAGDGQKITGRVISGVLEYSVVFDREEVQLVRDLLSRALGFDTQPQHPMEITNAIRQLQKSEAGAATIRFIHTWLSSCDPLDMQNQRAVLTLLKGAWGAFAGTTRDELATAVAGGVE